MRTRQEFINEYQRSHLHPLNQWIHIFCVPLIFVSSAGLMWSVSLARFWPSASPSLAPWLNLAVLVSLPILFFYARLGLSSFVSGLAWTLVSAAVCFAIQAAGWPLAWIAAAIWVIAWAVQFYGHEVEGAKPSLMDDLLFLLIGPLFVQDKVFAMLRGQGIARA
jgi:uncharacterized membrane protein YGL010W